MISVQAAACTENQGLPYTRFWTSDAPLDVRLWLEAVVNDVTVQRPLRARKPTSRCLGIDPHDSDVGDSRRRDQACAADDS